MIVLLRRVIFAFFVFWGASAFAVDRYQVVTPVPATQEKGSNVAVSVVVSYSTDPGSNDYLSGLGLRMFYDSRKLTYGSLTDMLLTSVAKDTSLPSRPPKVQEFEDGSNLDSDTSTDHFILVLWSNQDQGWPTAATPITLYKANFTTNATFSGTTKIKFGASTTATDTTGTWLLRSTDAVVSAPNQAPAKVSNVGLTVAEGGEGKFSTTTLQFTDDGTAAAGLTYKLTTAPVNGTLKNGTTHLAVNGTFTQTNVDAKAISYTHNGNEISTDSFVVTVSDDATSPAVSVSTTVNISVTPVNDDPVLETATLVALSVPEASAGKVIGSDLLKVTDADNTIAQLTFSQKTAPTKGTIQKSGQDVTAFTQADIDAGTITYKPLGDTKYQASPLVTDTLVVMGVDGVLGSKAVEATVNVTIAPPFGFTASSPVVLLGDGKNAFVFDVSNGTTKTAWTQSNAAAGGKLSASTGARSTYTAPTLAPGASFVSDVVTVTDGSLTNTVTVTIYSPLSTGITAATGVKLGSTDPVFATGMPAGGSSTRTCAINAVTGTDVATAASAGSCVITVSKTVPGTFTVTVTDTATYSGTVSNTGGNTTTTATIEVVKPITVTSGTIYLDTGTTNTGRITASGGKESYTYTSSDASKVTVGDNGGVTAVATGEVTVTITDKTYSNITASVGVVVAGPMTVKDAKGNAISTPQSVASDGTFKIAVSGGNGSALQSVTVTGPGSYTGTLTGVSGTYTFTAPTTGAFAGAYTIKISDSRLGTSADQTVTVYVPLKIVATKTGFLKKKTHPGMVAVQGAAIGDKITFDVLDGAGVKDSAAAIATIAEATTAAAASTTVPTAALGDVVTKDVTKWTTFMVRATNATQAVTKDGAITNGGYTQVTSGKLSVIPLDDYTITVVDSGGAVVEGATVAVVNPGSDLKGLGSDVTLSATSAVAMGSTGSATAKLVLVPGSYTVSVTPPDATKHQSAQVTMAAGKIAETVTLQKIVNGVTYTGSVIFGAGVTTDPAPAVVAVDANGKKVFGKFDTNTKGFEVTVDSASFTPVRFSVMADGAKMVTKEPGTTCSDTTYTNKSACEGAKATWTALTALGSFTLQPIATAPTAGTAAAAVTALSSVAITSVDVAKSVDKFNGTPKGIAIGQTVGGFAGDLAGDSMRSKVKMAIPADAFDPTIGDVDVFAAVSTVTVKQSATEVKQGATEGETKVAENLAKALKLASLNSGEIVDVNMVVSKGGTLQLTGSGNTTIKAGIPVTVPVNASALFLAVGTEDLATINSRLVVYTAPSLQDFLNGEKIETLQGAPYNPTFDPLTSTVTVKMLHFSPVVPGVAETPAAAGGGGSSGGCFIATAAYGSYEAPYVQLLRQFRDQALLTNAVGTWMVEQYYTYSPSMADWLRTSDGWRAVVRVLLLPLIALSWLVVQASFATQVLVVALFGVLPVGVLWLRRRRSSVQGSVA